MNAKIITKIKNLLELAADNPSDEESQTAFLHAQKLMLKHDVSMTDIEMEEDSKEVHDENEAYASARVTWWQRSLAAILAENFRCHALNRRVDGITRIVFFGEKSDVEAITLVFNSALAYLQYRLKRLSSMESGYKQSYLNGFLESLNDRFKKQVEEFGLMVLPSKETEEAFSNRFPNITIKKNPRPDSTFIREAYERGLLEGEKAIIEKDQILGEED